MPDGDPNVQLIVLAAGRGSRLGALGADQPKCMSLLLGQPWLDWQLAAFAAAGLGPVTLVSGHAGAKIPQRAGIAQRVHHPRWAQTGPVASLWCALRELPDTELLIGYGDCLWHPQWLTRLRDARSPIAISSDRDWLKLWSERFADPMSDAETFSLQPADAHGRVCLQQIGQRATRIADIAGQFMGLLRCDRQGTQQLRSLLSALPTVQLDRLDMTALLQRLLAAGHPIEVIEGGGSWIELDHASDLELYQRRSAESAWSHDWRRSPT